MSRLEETRTWYEARFRSLTAVRAWMRERPDVPRVLLPLVNDFFDKKLGPKRLKDEIEDLNRIALVRFFSAFEADFRERFCVWLKVKLDRLHPEQAQTRTPDGIAKALPDSIDACVTLFRALEPRFSGHDKGWLDTLRAYRNDVVHGGFAGLTVKEDPIQAYEKLKRILAYVDVIAVPA